MSDFLDQTRAVRSGEELDLDRLKTFFDAAVGPAEGELVVEQFPGGHSNLTYAVRHGDRSYVLRRPPRGSKVKSAHDMGREHRILSKLAPVYPKAPKPVAFCEDESILGSTFYVMERVVGVILRKQVPTGMTIDESTARKLGEVLVDTLAELHALDYDAIGLGDLGRPHGYIERQITGWTKRYAGSQTDDIPAVEAVSRWLADNMPEDGSPALIHNDFKFDNLVLDPADVTRVLAVLDWEMSTLGDPLMDFGTALCYWVEAADSEPMRMMAFGVTAIPGMMTRQALVDRYAEVSGRDVSNIVYYYCYGLFKTAVVAQQIYYRYAQGLTKDPRFAQMIFAVKLLAGQALACAESRSLSVSG